MNASSAATLAQLVAKAAPIVSVQLGQATSWASLC